MSLLLWVWHKCITWTSKHKSVVYFTLSSLWLQLMQHVYKTQRTQDHTLTHIFTLHINVFCLKFFKEDGMRKPKTCFSNCIPQRVLSFSPTLFDRKQNLHREKIYCKVQVGLNGTQKEKKTHFWIVSDWMCLRLEDKQSTAQTCYCFVYYCTAIIKKKEEKTKINKK